MTFIPKTLFGRLVLILLIGLLLTQAMSIFLLLKDRRQMISDRFGLNMIQRVASVVTLMEEISPEKRERLLTALSSPTFRVFMRRNALDRIDDTPRGNHLAFLLRQALGETYQVQVILGNQPKEFIDRMRHMNDREPRFRRWGGPPPPMIATVQIQLKTGEWLIFSRALPDEATSWPYKLLLILIILLLGVTLITLLAVRMVTRPLSVLTRAAEAIGMDINHPPLSEQGSQEMRRAARSFNTMQRRLQRYIDDRNQVLAAVSHDLKTPITRLRLRSELLEDTTLAEKIDQDLQQMEVMVSASLDYLRGTDSKEARVPVNLDQLLASIQDDMQELGFEVTLEEQSIGIIEARPLALKRCLTNLVENACRYGIRASVRSKMDRQTLNIIIADAGKVAPDLDLESLFEPFFRGEKSRSRETGGTGLGLGIARNIARSHGGDVVLRRASAGGVEAVVTLPR